MFWTAFQVVAGVVLGLSVLPILVWLLFTVTDLVKNKRLVLEAKLEDAKKAAPYDSVEVSQPPNPKMFTLRLMKNGEVVYEGSHDRDFN